MSKIMNIDDLIKEVGITTTHNIFMEYIMLLRSKSEILDKVQVELNKKEPDVRVLKESINVDISDGILDEDFEEDI